ncbi:GerAB/ArcD/ProY family transporter [Lysinibacillus sp. NPDC048646]|uniref:GerAB/ArcD/ProY family transporter n=1 Tax=Lysinibacillus sp. NPDC048646 TaxID=3390574 RepID=UPI003D04D5B4
MKGEIVSAQQFTIIVFLFSIGTTILIIPGTMANAVKQDAWIAAILGVVLSLLLVKLFISLGNRTPNLTFIEANEKILGKFMGKFTSVGFIFLPLLSAGELFFFIGTFMHTEVMPETPTVAFAILFSIIIIFATYLGVEVFARCAEILFPIFLFLFVVFIICISPQIDIKNVQPILDTPTKSLLGGILNFMSTFSFPLVVLLMIFPSAINEHKSAQKGFYIGTIAGGLVLTVIIALSILVLGATNTSHQSYPSYALAQNISIGNFLQRIEIIMAFMWMFTIFVRSYVYFYASVKGLAQIFNIKDHRPLILPLGMISIAFSQILHPSIVHSINYNKETWPLFTLTVTILLPLLLLFVAKLRKIQSTEKISNTINDIEEKNTN